MGWPSTDITDENFSAVDGSGDSLGKRWMHAFCIAVNERQSAMGSSSPSTWRIADGTLKANPTLADFDGTLPMSTDGTDDVVRRNLFEAGERVKAMVPGDASNVYAVTASQGDVAYTVGSLEAAVGEGTFPAAIEDLYNVQEAQTWRRLKGALDLLLFFKVAKELDIPGSPRIGSYDYNDTEPADTTANEAWTGAKVPENSDDPFAAILWNIPTTAGAQDYSAFIQDTARHTYATGQYDGILTKSNYKTRVTSQHLKNQWQFESDGVTKTVAAGIGSTIFDFLNHSAITIAIDTIIDSSIVTAPPALSPFDGGIPPTHSFDWGHVIGSGGVGFLVDYVTLWVDMASVLTDQA